MGREVRRVPKDWKHPCYKASLTSHLSGRYKPLLESKIPFDKLEEQWWSEEALWRKGEHPDQLKNEIARKCESFIDWNGRPPDQDDYMPWWPNEQKTHLQMYETCSEGTPISPVMQYPEQLAQWLVDHHASAFGNRTATYDQWLATIKRGWAPSAISSYDGSNLTSGVEAMAKLEGNNR